MEQGEQQDQTIITSHGACRQCKQWDEVKERIRIREFLEKAISKIEGDIIENTFKPSLGDYLKLMALEKDADEDEIKEIRVTWVGPKPQSAKSE